MMTRFTMLTAIGAGLLLLAPTSVTFAQHGAPAPAVAFAQTADEPERAAALDGSTLESGDRPAMAGPSADGPTDPPAFAPAVETSDNPFYGPGWSGPVDYAPPPTCPAWYGAHTDCVPASTPTAR